MSILFNVNDVIQIRLNFSNNVDMAFNILHYQIAAKTGALPGANTVLSVIGEEAVDKWGTIWAPGASNEISLFGASVQNIHPTPRSKLATFTAVAPVDGALASEALPLQDAPTIVKDTDYGERWGLGRLFYVGVPESMAKDGQVIAGVTRTALTNMANALDDNLDVIGVDWTMTLQPVLYHAATPETDDKPATDTRITRVTGGHVPDWVIKSMKTRRPGKGI